MDKTSGKSGKTGIFALIAVLLLVVVVCAGIIMTSGRDATDTGQQGNFSSRAASDSRDLFPDKAYPEYAEGYSVEYHGTYKVVSIHDPWGRTSGNHTYLLVQRGETVPEGYSGARVFFVPVQSVITLTVLHAAYLDELNETSSIAGHNGIPFVLNDAFRNRAEEGNITEVGSGTLSMNSIFQTEKMIDLAPDLVFCNANGNPEYDNEQKLEEAGLSLAVTAESEESHPLGRAEWIKYYALFFNKEKTANGIFGRIEANYTSISAMARNVSSHPTIFSGLEYQGTWYAPGGASYVAQLFRDAGGDYVLENDSSTGDDPIDFEIVYERAHNAEYFINIGYVGGIEELLAGDPRYAKFDAVKNGSVYHFDARSNTYGALDYWQSGVVHPDIVLADLVKILHPDLLPDHELYYYRHVGARTGDAS